MFRIFFVAPPHQKYIPDFLHTHSAVCFFNFVKKPSSSTEAGRQARKRRREGRKECLLLVSSREKDLTVI